MRRIIIISLLAITASCAIAQQQALPTAREEIRKSPCLSASNYLAYPGPKQQQLTPAPEGYTPCYISHYGRHGSRFLIDTMDYVRPMRVLMRADSAGVLTATGRDALHRIQRMYAESYRRWGELTQLGAEQHRDIARRMMERFPEVFRGSVVVDARSTVVIRCILSMTNELLQLQSMNPGLRITHDASFADMYYMNLRDRKIEQLRQDTKRREYCDQWELTHFHPERFMGVLFTNKDFLPEQHQQNRLYHDIFQLASAVQNSEIRREMTLYDLFTNDELYENWQRDNIYWFMGYGNSRLTQNAIPFSQRNLLRNIILTADSCLQRPVPGATLRFGHESMVLPLTCLMELNGFGQAIDDVETLEQQGWVNYRVFPMGANIQLVFYRKKDAPVLVKVLLNENEAQLPIHSDEAPYYKWEDVRTYYLNKLNHYEEP